MKRARAEAVLWCLAVTLAVAAVVWWRVSIPQGGVAAAIELSTPREPSDPDTATLASAAGAVVANDVFRLDRKPSSVAFQRVVAGIEPVPLPPVAAAPPRPMLVLSGIVGGPPWEALLDGVPGREGSVLVRAGDVLGSLTIRSIGRDTLIVRGTDTTWVLTLKRSWQ